MNLECGKGMGHSPHHQLHLVWMEPKNENIKSLRFQANLSWMGLKDSVHPDLVCIWSGECLRLSSLLVDCGHEQLPNVAKAATGDLFSQVLFGNSVWGLGAAGSFWVIAYPGGGGRPSTTAFPRDLREGNTGSQITTPPQIQGPLVSVPRWRMTLVPWGQSSVGEDPRTDGNKVGIFEPCSPHPSVSLSRWGKLQCFHYLLKILGSISWNCKRQVDDHVFCNVFL